jgi:tetratricopeptide (TPR) repeat protein
MTCPSLWLRTPFAIFALAASAFASEQAVIDVLAAAQEASHRGDMGAADSLTQAIIRRWPDDPTGYYARAALVQVRALGCPGAESGKQVEEYLDRAVSDARSRLLEAPDDTWARYILGLALGLKAVLAVREGSLWAAYRVATGSVHELEEVLRRDSTFADAWLPLGTYHFWRGEALKGWLWLPFIEDTRERGLQEIRRAATHGRTTRVSARSMLLWALLAARRNQEALDLAAPLVEQYPANRSFRWAQAEAYKALGRWREAEAAFAEVLTTFEPEHAGCPGPVEIAAKRGMALAELGECERAKPLLEAALRYEPPPAAQEFAEVRDEARRYLERCAQRNRQHR